jgi:hypothetical protein
MSDDTENERCPVDFKALFHFLCHPDGPILTGNVQRSRFFATGNEKFYRLIALGAMPIARCYWMVWAGSLTVGICLEIFALNSTRQAAAPPPWTSYTPPFGMGKPI